MAIFFLHIVVDQLFQVAGRWSSCYKISFSDEFSLQDPFFMTHSPLGVVSCEPYIFLNNYITHFLFYKLYMWNIRRLKKTLLKSIIYIFIRSISVQTDIYYRIYSWQLF
jgi:hypothetical protein